jgi:serine/threonine protein phosphatase PrpC
LNYNISVHPSYPSDIKKAMSAAFLVTDIEFLKKANAENLNSGTTALCAIYRKTQKKLYIGWCGDSQALIARLGNVHQIVRKHSPADASERKRIEDLGGVVLYWSNSYRVNGSLAVSRAIGDAMHKPFVSAEPEISVLDLDGEEDFFVMGCDGLWDSLTEDDIALTVYKRLKEDPSK